ncbi:MAG: PIG-L family deacetylase, partial [Clostridia bacterium]|nr:PIG-L family deacetylase [Clostridia bacterium]
MKKILVIAAHPDDELLGVGGTVARHAMQGDEVYTIIMCEGESLR